MCNLSIVIPCFNEAPVLDETVRRLDSVLSELKVKGKISADSKLFLVDDGSTDETWRIIVGVAKQRTNVHGIKLSRNRGHQNALLAGMFAADGDVVVSIDADLQDDLSAVEKMLDAFESGADIVYGVRGRRDSDTMFKRYTAESYYRLLRAMGVEVVFNHADYRLMSRRAVAALAEFGEVNLFLRGIIPQLGFASASVEYDRAERLAGESKYPVSKMLSLAIQGITSFSAVPLRVITATGLLVFLCTLVVSAWALGTWYFTDRAVPGWTSTVVPIFLLGGIQLLSIGVIGEYLAKIYMETKRRPRYVIEEKV